MSIDIDIDIDIDIGKNNNDNNGNSDKQGRKKWIKFQCFHCKTAPKDKSEIKNQPNKVKHICEADGGKNKTTIIFGPCPYQLCDGPCQIALGFVDISTTSDRGKMKQVYHTRTFSDAVDKETAKVEWKIRILQDAIDKGEYTVPQHSPQHSSFWLGWSGGKKNGEIVNEDLQKINEECRKIRNIFTKYQALEQAKQWGVQPSTLNLQALTEPGTNNGNENDNTSINDTCVNTGKNKNTSLHLSSDDDDNNDNGAELIQMSSQDDEDDADDENDSERTLTDDEMPRYSHKQQSPIGSMNTNISTNASTIYTPPGFHRRNNNNNNNNNDNSNDNGNDNGHKSKNTSKEKSKRSVLSDAEIASNYWKTKKEKAEQALSTEMFAIDRNNNEEIDNESIDAALQEFKQDMAGISIKESNSIDVLLSQTVRVYLEHLLHQIRWSLVKYGLTQLKESSLKIKLLKILFATSVDKTHALNEIQALKLIEEMKVSKNDYQPHIVAFCTQIEILLTFELRGVLFSKTKLNKFHADFAGNEYEIENQQALKLLHKLVQDVQAEISS